MNNIDVSKCKYFMKHNLMPMCRACNSGYGAPYCEYNPDCYYKQLKRKEKELQRYKDMEAKGLEEFKDIGGCWGCGIQAQVNQDMVDLKNLKAENEELKNKIDSLQVDKWAEEDAPTIKEEKYYNALQEIKNLNLFSLNNSQEKITRINKIISEVEE